MMTTLSRNLTSVFVAFMTLVAGVACAQPLQDIAIAVSSSSLGASPARLASEMGLFGKRGLAPKISIMENSSDALAALLAGSVNLSVAGTPELIVAQGRGQTQLVAIATSAAGVPSTLVLSKAVADKLGVAAGTPAERLKALDGLTIASPSAISIGTVTLRRATQGVGATIRWTYMSQPAMQSALEAGAIQGYFASSPYWVAPILRNKAVLWLSGPKGEIPPELAPALASQVQTRRSYAEANRSIVENVVGVFNDFAKAVKERPAEVKAAIAKLYPDLDMTTIDLLFDSESQLWTGGQATPQAMAREIELLKASGLTLPQLDLVQPAGMLFP